MTVLYVHRLRGGGLADVSFHLDAGERLGLIGGAGAGKSALRDALLGRASGIDGGRVLFANRDIAEMSEADIAALAPGGIAWASDLGDASLDAIRSRAPRVLIVNPPSYDPAWPAALAEREDALTTMVGALGAAMIITGRHPGEIPASCDSLAVLCGGRLVERLSIAEADSSPIHPYRAALVSGDTGPSPDVEEGCPYRGACPQAASACETASPELQAIDLDRSSACVRWRELARLAA